VPTAREAIAAQRQIARAMSADPDRRHTEKGIKTAYVSGEIGVAEMEQRLQDLLDGTVERRDQEAAEARKAEARRRCRQDGHSDLVHPGGHRDPLCVRCGASVP
jgi:hypothetical protein